MLLVDKMMCGWAFWFSRRFGTMQGMEGVVVVVVVYEYPVVMGLLLIHHTWLGVCSRNLIYLGAVLEGG